MSELARCAACDIPVCLSTGECPMCGLPPRLAGWLPGLRRRLGLPPGVARRDDDFGKGEGRETGDHRCNF